MLFAGKRALITGAASGIGRATAIKFSQEGATITIGDRNEEGLEETAKMMAATPTIQPFDATDFDSCRKLVDVASKGGLDVVCNISGLLKWGPTANFSVEDYELLMKVNATSVFVICQAAMPHLLESKGNIVNTASTAALQGQPFNIAYSASKHAVAAITRGLAVEYAAQGVRVNAICPGMVTTPMTMNTPPPEGVDWPLMMRNAPKLLDGACDPEDIAEMFAFLASDKGRKITGVLFNIDGGQMAG